jgi:N-acetylglucosamine-6-phosphate deacetylase
MGIVIHSARVITGGRERAEGWLRFADGLIEATGTGDGWRDASAAGDEAVDARELAGEGAVLSPGMIDLHGHGGGGAAHEDGPEGVRTARAVHRSHGTTRAIASLVTGDLGEMAAHVAEIAQLTESDADVLGSHLEGPFLDPGHKGAHDPALLRAPEPAEVDRLIEAGLIAGRQTIRQVTIAPELPGGLDAVRRLTEAGIVCAIGHTDADAETTRRAIEAGATLLTHTFNAMPGIHHRDPGPIPVAADDDRIVLELIADGVHVADEVMLMLFRGAPGRIALVTDAMAATGMPDGDYAIGSLAVVVADGVARLRDGGSIAGSTLTQDAAVRRVAGLGVPLPEAIRAATEVPARVIGRSDLGSLHEGSVADAVLWDEELNVRAVWTGGTRS